VSVSVLYGSAVAGQLGEGRWIQYVKVNPAQRRARIAALQRANRLRVCLQMPKLRKEQGITQGRVGPSGCAILAQCARMGKPKSGNGDAVPPGSKKRPAVPALGNAAGDVEDQPPTSKQQVSRTAHKSRKAPKAKQDGVKESNCADPDHNDAHAGHEAAQAGEVGDEECEAETRISILLAATSSAEKHNNSEVSEGD
jgi:hypothetical protein